MDLTAKIPQLHRGVPEPRVAISGRVPRHGGDTVRLDDGYICTQDRDLPSIYDTRKTPASFQGEDGAQGKKLSK